MEPMPTLQERLNRAMKTYDDWMNGERVSSFTDSDGLKVDYSAANLIQLRSHIQRLKAEIAGHTDETPRPIYPY